MKPAFAAALVPLSLSLACLAGCKATRPGKWETRLMTSAKQHLFVGDKKEQKPLPPTPKHIAQGRRAFS
jgi:hypothetical protein